MIAHTMWVDDLDASDLYCTVKWRKTPTYTVKWIMAIVFYDEIETSYNKRLYSYVQSSSVPGVVVRNVLTCHPLRMGGCRRRQLGTTTT